MKKTYRKTAGPDPLHVWLVMIKAMHAISRFARADIGKEGGIGDSDFRVLEILLHKGPMPVNAMGPKVDLTPGSISVAVDRLHKKGFVTRVECSRDRRVRTVALTSKGRELITPLFRRHAATMKKIFSELSHKELEAFEGILKKIGRRAEAFDKPGTDSKASCKDFE